MKCYHYLGSLADYDPEVILAYEEQRVREAEAFVIDLTDPQADYE